MEKKSDITKTIALILIILTVVISATSTWVLINKSMSSEPEYPAFNRALIHLNILKGEPYEPVQTDTNSGNVKLFISKAKGG
jgi:hypothetical protein